AGMMDGVCVSNQVAGIHFSNCEGTDFRRYNQYHTFTHEIAHTLGLLHTFNQDLRQDPFTHTSRVKHINDDFVIDTPDQDRASQGNVYEHANWPQDKRDDAQPYQFMNFM